MSTTVSLSLTPFSSMSGRGEGVSWVFQGLRTKEGTGGDGFDGDRLGAVLGWLGDVLLGVEGRVEESVDESRFP